MMGWLRALAYTLLVALVTAQPTADAKNDSISLVVDAVGNRLPPPAEVPSKVGSPSNLLHPDRYEFYTFDETGELVKRLMTLEEIRAIVASEDDEDGHLVTLAQASPNKPAIAFNFSHPPHIKVHSVVTNVQNVLKAEMEAQKNKPPNTHFLDTPDVSASWSAILPSIFGNTGIDIVPDIAPSAFGTPETDTLETYVTKSETTTENTQVISEEAKEEVVGDNSVSLENSNTKVTGEIMTTIISEEITTTTTEPSTNTTQKATTIPSTTVTHKTIVTKPRTTQKPPIRITTKTPPKKSTSPKLQTKAPTKTTTPKDDYAAVNNKATSATFLTKKPTPNKIKLSTTTKIPTTSSELIEIYNTSKKNQTMYSTNALETSTSKNSVTTTFHYPISTAIKPIEEISNSISVSSYVSPSAPITITTYRPILNLFASSQANIPLGITKNKIAPSTEPAPTSMNVSALPTLTNHTTSLTNLDEIHLNKLDILDPVKVTATNFVSVPIVDQETPPTFNVADSISQIALDLGNLFSTPEPNVGHNLGLEIKENVDITIPIDSKTEVTDSKVLTTTEVEPFTLSISTEQKLDSHDSDIYFVKLTTKNTSLATGSLTLNTINLTASPTPSEIPTDSSVKKEASTTYTTTETYTETHLPSIMELSASVTDLLSQVTNDAPLTVFDIKDGITTTSEAPIDRHADMDILTTTEKRLVIMEKENIVETKDDVTTLINILTTELYSTTENMEYLESTTDDALNNKKSSNTDKSEIVKEIVRIDSTEYITESIYPTTQQSNRITTDETESSTIFSSTATTEVPVFNDNAKDMLRTEITSEATFPITEVNNAAGFSTETDTTTSSSKTLVTTLSEDLTSYTDMFSENNKYNNEDSSTTGSLVEYEEDSNTKAVITNLDNNQEKTNIEGVSVMNKGTPSDIISSSFIKEDLSKKEIPNHLVITTEKYVQNVSENASTQKVSEYTANQVEVINNSENSSISDTSSSPSPTRVKDEKIKTATKLPTTIQMQTFSPNLSHSTTSQYSDNVEHITEGNVNEQKLKPAKPKPEDPKKKVQKVNIDFKEHLGTSHNNSWKLISTVSPPNNDNSSLTGINSSVNLSKPLSYQKPKPTNDPNKQLNLDGSNENQGLESTTKNLDEDVYQFTELSNELAFRYWSAITSHKIDKKRSLVISPFAINSMLAMMFMGARGGTSGEMNEILKLDDMVTFNPHFTLKNITDSIEISPQSGVAASAFIRELYSDREKGKILAFYKERAQQFYNGHVEETNFKLINDIIRRRTNLLVKRHTWGKIPEYLKGNTISMQPPLAALSVNVFETDCSSSSSEGRDGEMYFVVSPSVRQRRLVPVPSAVYKKGFLAGYEPVLDATVAAVGTASAVVSTIFVMPGQQGNSVQADDLDELQKRLLASSHTSDSWNRLLRTLLPRMGLELQIPRFSHRSVLNISSTLKEMGLKDLFDPEEADLRGLNGLANDLYLSDMIHATTFATCGENIIGDLHHVESYPTEPARAKRSLWWFKPRQEMSSLSDGWDEPRDYQRAFHDPHDLGAMYMPLHLRPRQARLPQPKEAARLKFDRPFLFFVRHNPSGMILYMGRYNPRLLP